MTRNKFRQLGCSDLSPTPVPAGRAAGEPPTVTADTGGARPAIINSSGRRTQTVTLRISGEPASEPNLKAARPGA